jgi:hypothetical protein
MQWKGMLFALNTCGIKKWKEIGKRKSVIEKLLIKHFFVSFYTPVGAMAKVSEWYSLTKVNQSKMTAKYRLIFKVHFSV